MSDDEKKQIVSPDTTATLYVNASIILKASTSANAVIQSFVKQFSERYGEKADELDKVTKKNT